MTNAETRALLGADCLIQPYAIVGMVYRPGCGPARLGDACIVRAYTIIYGDVRIGDGFRSGHHALIREHTIIGDYVLVGTGTTIDGHVEIGDYVSIQTGVYIPTQTVIGSYVFIGPGAVLTNDKYPLRQRATYEAAGPVLADHVTIGANVTLLPGVHIGEGAMVAAGSSVTIDVPPWSLAMGVPARIQPLPQHLHQPNSPIFGPASTS
ncbi:MAG: N-acetyltransferase [Chloroflexi bacterium]|nr:N-acetyltransferase [Chloroflexota bacterium]